jgi:hypothetical protein
LWEDFFRFLEYSPPQDLVGGDVGEGVKALYLKARPLTFILSRKGRGISKIKKAVTQRTNC